MEDVVWFNSRRDKWADLDPIELANALDHIAKTCRNSRSQTRRIRWIEKRAEIALDGREYHDADFDLPKKATTETMERLQKKYSHKCWQVHQMLEALQAIAYGEGCPHEIARQTLEIVSNKDQDHAR